MKRLGLRVVKAFCLLMCFVCISNAEDHAPLIDHAIITFNQRKPDITALRAAAATGSREAQFYLAETLRLDSSDSSREAYGWYIKSARQGDIYSMFRLSKLNQDICKFMEGCTSDQLKPERWGGTLRETALEMSKLGDPKGMEMMYAISGDLDWLIRAASSGYAGAQWWLANRYTDGDGWFLWPTRRKNEIENLYKAAAENGHPLAISEYAAILLLKGDISAAQEWLLKGVATGYVHAIGTYAYSLQYGKYYNFEKDLELAYALNLVLSEVGGGMRDTSRYLLKELYSQLTNEQIRSATRKSKIWKANHPSASYYPPKLEFLY